MWGYRRNACCRRSVPAESISTVTPCIAHNRRLLGQTMPTLGDSVGTSVTASVSNYWRQGWLTCDATQRHSVFFMLSS
jgi:hypothetical protein